MNSRVWQTPLVAGCALALALSGAACNKAGHVGAPITVTGCIQKGDGLNNYMLTQVNSPSEGPVATSGNNSVQGEQMRAARHAYELSGHHDDLENLVGKQARVTGTIEENSELYKKTQDRDRTDIDANDLAKIDVQAVEKIAEACGQK